MLQAATRSYLFGPFLLIPSERVLLREGESVPLTPKAFALLVLLVEHAGSAVSKDQILDTLWPARFVIEANLTKHIWMLRRALGGGDDDYIKTVPKLGYRFVARVVEASPHEPDAPAGQPPSLNVRPESAPSIEGDKKRWPRGKLAAGLVVGALSIAAFTFVQLGRDSAVPYSSAAGRTVALTDPIDLSPARDTAWIGPAVREMLGTSLSLGGTLRTVPGELVNQAAVDLPVPKTGGYGPSSLVTLKRRLDTDYVVSGSYFETGDQIVRLDFVIQDVRNHATLATVTESGNVTDLPAVTNRAAESLSHALTGRLAPTTLAALTPPTSETMRHMGLGLEALRNFDDARARDEFLEAVTDAPSYAPAYAQLSRAWLGLGYRSKGLAAAEQAVARSQGLPQPVRLQIAAQRSEAAFDWPAAIANRRSLVALDPVNPEYQLQLVDTLTEAGKLNDAQLALTRLRNLGGQVSMDGRIEIVASRLANARGDSAGCIAHAVRALELARAHDAPGQAADAEALLGSTKAATDKRIAASYLMQALTDYRTIRNPRGEASVYRLLGVLFSDVDPAKARAYYTNSLAVSEGIGDKNGMAAAEADIGTVLWAAGDRDAAEAATRRVFALRKETDDAAGQAWALAALAVEQTDESASDEAIANFRRAIALDRTVNATSHIAFTLYSLSDVLRLRGRLVEAANLCAQAEAAYASLPDSPIGGAAFECALIALDRGRLSEVGAGLARAYASASRQDDVLTMANAQLTLGQIEMGRRNWSAAADRIGRADRLFTRSDIVTGEALTASLLASCDFGLGRKAQAKSEIERATKLRSRITADQESVMTDIALAQYRGRTGQRDQAAAALDALERNARRRQWLSWALEARLAELEFLKPPAAARARGELAAQARQYGFLWIAQRLS